MIPLLRKWDNDIQDILHRVSEISSQIYLFAIIEITGTDNTNLSSEQPKVWKNLESKNGYHYAESLLSDNGWTEIQIPEEQSTCQSQKVTNFDNLIKGEPNVLERRISELSEYYKSVLGSLKQQLSLPHAFKNMENEIVPKPISMEQNKLLRNMHYFENQEIKSQSDLFPLRY